MGIVITGSFVHLHTHSEYSLLDGLSRVSDLVARAKELGMPAIALTDHGALYGAVDFYVAANQAGIKPILGVETYIARTNRFERDPRLEGHGKPFHLVLLAKDFTGYRNLVALVTTAHLDGYYYRPRMDKEILRQHSKGLIALSACLQDLLADMVSHPRFEQQDLEREQKVILEEMKMVEDTPDELLGELFNAAYFPNHPLGRPIEGTRDTVSGFDHETTAVFHEREFSPTNLVIAAAGNVEHARLVEMAELAFPNDSPRGSNGQDGSEADTSPTPAAPILIEQKKELEQAHLIIAAPFPTALNDARYSAGLLASIIGGGTSSRLWQKIREERGLAYSVGAGGSTYSDAGVFMIYAGASPEHLDEVVDLSLAELKRVVNESVSNEELRLAKDQSISSILLGLESSSARASALARQEIIHHRRISPDEIVRRIEAVSCEDVQSVANSFFTTDKLALGALGNLNGFRVDRSRLQI